MRQIAVMGLGNFGSSVAKELTERGANVIAIDRNKQKVEDIKEFVSHAVALDTTDKDALKSVNIQNVDVAIVCIGDNVESNLLTTLLLKKMGVEKVWARAINPLQQEILKSLEVSEIISIEEEMGRTVARNLVSVNVMKHIPVSPGHSIAEVQVPMQFVAKTIRHIDPRKKYDINIVAIKKNVPAINEYGEREFSEQFEDVPSPDRPLEEGDVLLVIGSDESIEKFSKMKDK